MRLYLDTDIWNAMCDQEIDPISLLKDLDGSGATVVLGMHVIFEFVKTFTTGNHARGTQLFSKLNSFLSAGLRCITKDVFEVLVAEMYALKGTTGADKFLSYEDIAKVRHEVALLTSGTINYEWNGHVLSQAAGSRLDRTRIREALSVKLAHREFFRSISEDQFRDWLERSTNTSVGRELLSGHLQRRFPQEPASDLLQYASELLRNGSRTAESLVKADLYYTWRCARRGSNPPDLLDDIYHILSASYSDIYVSGERKQAEYASLLLKHDVRVCIYPRGENVADWLCGIASPGAQSSRRLHRR